LKIRAASLIRREGSGGQRSNRRWGSHPTTNKPTKKKKKKNPNPNEGLESKAQKLRLGWGEGKEEKMGQSRGLRGSGTYY